MWRVTFILTMAITVLAGCTQSAEPTPNLEATVAAMAATEVAGQPQLAAIEAIAWVKSELQSITYQGSRREIVDKVEDCRATEIRLAESGSSRAPPSCAKTGTKIVQDVKSVPVTKDCPPLSDWTWSADYSSADRKWQVTALSPDGTDQKAWGFFERTSVVLSQQPPC